MAAGDIGRGQSVEEATKWLQITKSRSFYYSLQDSADCSGRILFEDQRRGGWELGWEERIESAVALQKDAPRPALTLRLCKPAFA